MDAFSLPSVMVVSVLMLLSILMAYSLTELFLARYSKYHADKQQSLHMDSALELYCHDSTLRNHGDTTEIQLFEDDPGSRVLVSSGLWGLYEHVCVTTTGTTQKSRMRMVGKRSENDDEAAFWLCDRNRALSMAGSSAIEGLAYIPLNGVNYTALGGKEFDGKKIPYDRLRVADRSLPEVDSAIVRAIASFRPLKDRAVLLGKEEIPGHVTFEGPGLFACTDVRSPKLDLHGKVVLFADEELVLGPESSVSDILVFARSARVKSGFDGSLQLFCTDSVVVEKDAHLRSPSGIFIDAGTEHPCIVLEEDSRVEGYAVVLQDDEFDYELRNPSFRQGRGSLLDGLLFIDGSCRIMGSVEGAAYVKDCFYSENGVDYPGVLCDSRIVRSDGIAFPLLMTGPGERKVMKKLF